MSWWLTLITASPWLDFLPSRANPHHFYIASIFMAKPCVPEALAIFSWAFLVCRWLIPVSPPLFIHSGFFFPSFQKPWMIWGPVVAVALTAVTAAALLRTWEQQAQTHTRIHTHIHANTVNQDSRARRQKKKECSFLSRTGRKMALVKRPITRSNRRGLQNITQTVQ